MPLQAAQQPRASAGSRRGVPPGIALRTVGHLLTPYEKSEVLHQPEVWYAGRVGVPKIFGDPRSLEPNCGYDDSRGDYLAVTGDHLGYRYEVLPGSLGRGSFGQVRVTVLWSDERMPRLVLPSVLTPSASSPGAALQGPRHWSGDCS